MTTYIAGPMSPYAFGFEETPEGWDYNHPAFHQVASVYREAGHEVVNPAEVGPPHESVSWEDGIRECIRVLLDCDHIVLLPGWRASKGASLEHHVATELGFEVTYLEER